MSKWKKLICEHIFGNILVEPDWVIYVSTHRGKERYLKMLWIVTISCVLLLKFGLLKNLLSKHVTSQTEMQHGMKS